MTYHEFEMKLSFQIHLLYYMHANHMQTVQLRQRTPKTDIMFIKSMTATLTKLEIQ